MKKTLLLAAVLAVATTGCYTSRRIAGDDLQGGLTNPSLWVTVPVDTLLSPYQIPKWIMDESDDWTPFNVDDVRRNYHQDNWAKNELQKR